MRRSTFFYIESIACGLAIIAGITIFSDISDQDKFIEELKSGKLDSVVKRDGNKWHTYNGHEMTETEFLQIRDNLITIRRLKYQKGRFFPELLFEYNPRANYITGNPNYIKSLNLDNLLEQYGKQK